MRMAVKIPFEPAQYTFQLSLVWEAEYFHWRLTLYLWLVLGHPTSHFSIKIFVFSQQSCWKVHTHFFSQVLVTAEIFCYHFGRNALNVKGFV